MAATAVISPSPSICLRQGKSRKRIARMAKEEVKTIAFQKGRQPSSSPQKTKPLSKMMTFGSPLEGRPKPARRGGCRPTSIWDGTASVPPGKGAATVSVGAMILSGIDPVLGDEMMSSFSAAEVEGSAGTGEG